MWQDRRAEAVVDRLRAHAEEVHQRTGLVLDCYFTAPKMVWLRENLTREGVVTTTDTWIANRLTGEFVTDVTTASRSLLLNIDTGDWDARLQEVFGLDEELPRIVDCDQVTEISDRLNTFLTWCDEIRNAKNYVYKKIVMQIVKNY